MIRFVWESLRWEIEFVSGFWRRTTEVGLDQSEAQGSCRVRGGPNWNGWCGDSGHYLNNPDSLPVSSMRTSQYYQKVLRQRTPTVINKLGKKNALPVSLGFIAQIYE